MSLIESNVKVFFYALSYDHMGRGRSEKSYYSAFALDISAVPLVSHPLYD